MLGNKQAARIFDVKSDTGSILLALILRFEPMQSARSLPKVAWTLIPAGVWLSVFMILPLIIIGVFSLGYRTELGTFSPGFSFHNFLRFFQGPYLNCLWRSIGLSFSTTALCLLLGFPVASWLAFSVPREKQNLFMVLLTVPISISFLLRIYAWITILRPTGLAGELMQALGVLHPPALLYTHWAVLLGMVYNYVPYMILPLYAALEKLDWRLVEAAHDLGSTPLQSLFRIVIPLSFRGIVAGVIMVFVPSLGDYVTPDLMGGAKNMYIGSLIQNQYLAVRDWAFGSAVSSILLLLVAVGVFFYLKYAEKPAAV
ncbi:MAG: ABC transporter permease [Candidatus Obscuribacterales bacterium]|nr:ABC transporter permease [Candidatus Obscuribacterales bacterium]